ncbi:MAG: LacI family transcriptional regulator [Treponema sp.]|nr:LacI family transcriptional regulator [Treponema sp.]
MVKQKEIAARAGVSISTVSRVFTKKANVHPATLRKIQTAMYDLGAEMPDGLTQGKNLYKNYVMIIAGDISNGFYSQIIKGCCNSLVKSGMYAVVCNSDYNIEYEKHCISYADREKFSGIILITAVEAPGLVELLRHTQIPVVLSNRYIRSLDMNMVCIDNYNGGYIATDYLINRGHRAIAFLGGFKNSTATQDRFKGYTDALRDAGLESSPEWIVFSDQTINNGRKFASEAIQRGVNFTALFSTNCPLAVGAVNRFAESGFKVSENLSVICFDDSPSIGEDGLNLTAVSCEPNLIGQETVASLLRMLGGEFTSKTTLLLSPHLIERASVRRVDDCLLS